MLLQLVLTLVQVTVYESAARIMHHTSMLSLQYLVQYRSMQVRHMLCAADSELLSVLFLLTAVTSLARPCKAL